MKKKYQIAKQRAVQDFRQMAERDNPAVEMVLPMAEIASHLQQGVGHLMRQAGLELMKLVMAEEVKQLVGDRYAQDGNRRAHRWGQEDGYCVVDGQKVPIQRQRVRDKENKEVRLGSYELFQRQGPMQAAVRDRMMRGLSTRNYGAVTKQL
jgi:putative transposase